MRILLLTTVLIIGFVLAVSAQSQSSAGQDTGSRKFKIGRPGISSLRDSLNNRKLNVPFSTKNLYFQDPKDKEMKLGKPTEGKYLAQRGMPIYKPQGSYSMPVYKPDSTIKFFMQIKKVKKLPLNDFK